ncbi:CopG family ribbon-helix-helix protein [Pelobacter propionicus]|uniref:Transcriptional regulator, CopG family n=1 Tax=Pelobacter propionicus (strain DSM 2379 / NBRC 103807 / OttBd1) TaxID=338966 RepID=A0R863_PELPD|nr:ribbon-helix-helix domain-containing protein [Pelobacter propionicus]ABL01430.1 transcriptional regulator, CopG family [Pelobacter propionicus DSM 2379]
MRKAAAISLRIEPEIKTRLESLARVTRRSKSFLVEDALEAYLGVNEWQIRGIMEAVQEADSLGAEWTSHEDLKAAWEARRDQMA